MAVVELKPEISELLRTYCESHSNVFLEEVVRPAGFIRGAGCTKEELDAIYAACVTRGKELRAPKGRRRGRPSGNNRMALAKVPPDSLILSDLAKYVAGGPQELWDRDQAQHGWFRDVCVALGDVPANRPLFLKEILLFIQDSKARELAVIREAVARQRKKVKRVRRGRPDVRHVEAIMDRAFRVAWMRIVQQRTDIEIAQAIGLRIIEPIRLKNGLTSRAGNLASIRRQIHRLEDYFAAQIWRAIPATFTRVSAAGREIAPGALDSKQLQNLIRWHVGLPFDSHSEDCKRIVERLWPRGSRADWELFERGFSYRQKMRSSGAS